MQGQRSWRALAKLKEIAETADPSSAVLLQSECMLQPVEQEARFKQNRAAAPGKPGDDNEDPLSQDPLALLEAEHQHCLRIAATNLRVSMSFGHLGSCADHSRSFSPRSRRSQLGLRAFGHVQ